jgi:hypothetical protein
VGFFAGINGSKLNKISVESGARVPCRALPIQTLVLAVDAGLKRQRFRRFCSQRKLAIGQDAVPTLQQFLNLPA